MEILVQAGFRVIRGPDWSYSNQDGGKGHAGTVLRQNDECRPNLPKHSVLVQWDNGDKGLYRVGYDQAFDLRIIDTANAVSHPKIWCDGCDTDEIKGMRWRCTECYAIDLCTTCYMNNKHNTSHVFMRVMSSDKSSMGPKMLPRSSSSRIALRGSFYGATVVRYPQWFKRIESEAQVGKVVKKGQTAEERVKVQSVVEFMCKPERVDFIKMSCTQPGFGDHVYEGHLPILGDPELVGEGDKVLVTATPAELEKLHKRRKLWEPDMAQTFRRKGFVNGRTNTGAFKVTFNDTQGTFIMNSTALRKLHPLSLGQLVRISDDIEMVKRLQSGHGGWTAAMKKELCKVGKVVKIDGLDVHVKIEKDRKFIFNSANLTPARILFPDPAEEETFAERIKRIIGILHHRQDPVFSLLSAVTTGDIEAVETILLVHPEWIHYELQPDVTLLHGACHGDVSLVKLLVEKGAFIDSYGENNPSPLIVATNENNFEVVNYLLDKGADVHAIDRRGFTGLALACSKGFFQSAHYLLMHGADVNQKGEHDLTPALLSLVSGGRTIVDLVFDRKEADLKAVADNLLSAMHYAAKTDSTYALTKLLDKVPRMVQARDLNGLTPIMLTARTGSLKSAELLIQKGRCDVNAQEYNQGIYPLSDALAHAQFHMVDILIRHGADPNIPVNCGNTSLHIALNAINVISCIPGQDIKEEPYMAEMKKKWGHLGIKTNTDALLAFLVYHGSDLNARNMLGITIREQLAEEPILPSLVEIQTQKGKDITRQQSSANRPLRNVTKKSNTTESKENPVHSLLKKSTTETGSKVQNDENTVEHLPSTPGEKRKSSGKKSKKRRGKAAAESRAHEAIKKTSEKADLEELQAQLQRKDDELETLRSRVQTLEHLVKKKITFSCGHDVIRSIAELIPECPNCSEPITSVVDL